MFCSKLNSWKYCYAIAGKIHKSNLPTQQKINKKPTHKLDISMDGDFPHKKRGRKKHRHVSGGT